MKKRAIRHVSIMTLTFLVLLFSVSSVFASMNIDTISGSNFNYGDKLLVSGNIKLLEDTRGFLYIALVCDGKTTNLFTTLMELKKDIPSSFSQILTLPNTVSGSCAMFSKLVSGSETIETATSNGFTVTNDLTGTFEVNVDDNVQLGDTLIINGAIIRADKTGVDGTAVVNFKQGEDIIFFEAGEISGGQLVYKKDLNLIPAGSYTVDINVMDNFGNSHYYNDIVTFDISDKLSVTASVDKSQYLPGEVLSLTGNVKPTSDSVVENLNLEASFESNKINQFLQDSKFPFTIKYIVPSDMKSGDHSVKLVVKDEKGNYGANSFRYSVKAVPKILSVNLNQTNFIPEENLVFKVSLLDQAMDNLDENVMVKLYNQKGEFEKSKLVNANGYDFFIIPYMGLPGNWKITVEGFGLTDEKTLVVLPYKKIKTDIADGVLYIKNIGNVEYDDYVNIDIGLNKVKSKKVVLALNETTFFDLNDLFDPGVYDEVKVKESGQSFALVKIPEKKGFFDGFRAITGNVVSNLSSPSKGLWFVGLFLMVVVGLILVFRPARKEVYTESQRARDIRDGQKKLDELRSKGIRKGPIGSYGVATEEDRKDFANRMAKQVEEEQSRQAKENFSSKWSGNSRDLQNYSHYNGPNSSTQPSSSSTSTSKDEKIKDGEGFSGGGFINW